MKRIRFELTGMLYGYEFEKDKDVKEVSEGMFKKITPDIKEVSGCEVINDSFIIDIIDINNTDELDTEDKVEKDITYNITLETKMYSSLLHEEILKEIHHIAQNIGNKLRLYVVEPCMEYEYLVLTDNILFGKVEFIDTILSNIENDEIKKLSFDIVGFNYFENESSVEEVISTFYEKLSLEDKYNYSRKMLLILEKNTDMKYYKLFTDYGLSMCFKTDLYVDDEGAMEIGFKKFSNSEQFCEFLSGIKGIKEITAEEFYY